MTDGARPAKWEYFEASPGARTLVKEIERAKLSTNEAAKLHVLLNRIAEGATLPGDVDNLGAGLLEARMVVANRTFRLVFARVGADGLVLLGLTFFQKKSQKTPQQALDRASKRLKQWQSELT